ncbi:hypothetical protein K505DRAFT_331620 [Melanomma pulvis-pyrius CBS 109.77]|uniref:Uncharacterized protein n=1 Tax=Melanomma pulvis-pyrius CBS 109.77 TaxID=1314802 RepID=A0A6A6XY30_9PLEO|nr:hypothetical protein K505DRAFT_331620 [Melanomma pulvis-pyrius CBS 109.77]
MATEQPLFEGVCKTSLAQPQPTRQNVIPQIVVWVKVSETSYIDENRKVNNGCTLTDNVDSEQDENAKSERTEDGNTSNSCDNKVGQLFNTEQLSSVRIQEITTGLPTSTAMLYSWEQKKGRSKRRGSIACGQEQTADTLNRRHTRRFSEMSLPLNALLDYEEENPRMERKDLHDSPGNSRKLFVADLEAQKDKKGHPSLLMKEKSSNSTINL